MWPCLQACLFSPLPPLSLGGRKPSKTMAILFMPQLPLTRLTLKINGAVQFHPQANEGEIDKVAKLSHIQAAIGRQRKVKNHLPNIFFLLPVFFKETKWNKFYFSVSQWLGCFCRESTSFLDTFPAWEVPKPHWHTWGVWNKDPPACLPLTSCLAK